MTWLADVKCRRRSLGKASRLLDVEKTRVKACKWELIRIQDFRRKSYRIMWSNMLKHYNEQVMIERDLYGRDNLFWVLTGKRWLLKDILYRVITNKFVVAIIVLAALVTTWMIA